VSALTTAQVIARFVTSLEAGMPTGWRRSVFAPSMIGRDGGPREGKIWSVEAPSLTVTEGRQRVKAGVGFTVEPWSVEDLVVVRWLVKLRPDGMVTDYDAGVAMDGLIVKALYTGATAIVVTDMGTPLLRTSARTLEGDGTFLLGEMRFELTRLFGLPA